MKGFYLYKNDYSYLTHWREVYYSGFIAQELLFVSHYWRKICHSGFIIQELLLESHYYYMKIFIRLPSSASNLLNFNYMLL